MTKQEILSAAGVVLGWTCILLAAGTYLLFWRVDNEPGYRGDATGMLLAAILLAGSGGLSFLFCNIYLITKRYKFGFLIAWLLVIVISIGAISVAPILLLFLV